MQDSGYMQTGKQIPIKENELMNTVYEKLERYDYQILNFSSAPTYNPYKEPIIHTTSDGKTVQVPANIQTQAVNNWRSTNTDNDDKQTTLVKDEFDGDNYDKCDVPVQTEEKTDYTYACIILLLAVGLGVYFYKSGRLVLK